MTYNLSWLVPGRVIDLILPALSGDDAMVALDKDINTMLDTASQPVTIMIDLRQVEKFPSAQTSMMMSYYKHPMMQRLVVIGLTSNPMLRFLGTLIGRGVGIQMKDFGSREEALAYLASVEKISY